MKKKSKALVIPINQKNAGLSLVKELKKMENVEDLGTSIYHTSNQFYLLLQSILREKHNFTEEDLKKLNKEVIVAVEGLHWFEEKGLNPMQPSTIAQLTDIVLNHYDAFKAAKAGIALPTGREAKKLLQK
jgi:hypothetical protein